MSARAECLEFNCVAYSHTHMWRIATILLLVAFGSFFNTPLRAASADPSSTLPVYSLRDADSDLVSSALAAAATKGSKKMLVFAVA